MPMKHVYIPMYVGFRAYMVKYMTLDNITVKSYTRPLKLVMPWRLNARNHEAKEVGQH